jgi:flagellar biosynthesis/type III secretory pathway M-ring protein FliF/YscJ|tara:strand:+ start:260 stop:364 length:105 start_codon:yes stop_codon:yes gene_type:complete
MIESLQQKWNSLSMKKKAIAGAIVAIIILGVILN